MLRKPISEWPLTERPREKLLHDGSHTLSDAELLAIILRLEQRVPRRSILRGQCWRTSAASGAWPTPISMSGARSRA